MAKCIVTDDIYDSSTFHLYEYQSEGGIYKPGSYLFSVCSNVLYFY